MIRLLIVEDEMLLRHGIVFLGPWETYGFTVVGEASNGVEAIALIPSLKPDIVLTDIVMPGMDGIELTKQIKAKHRDMVVVLLSSYDHFLYARKAIKAGASDYVLKAEVIFEQMLVTLRAAYNKTVGEYQSVPRIADTRRFLYRLLQDKKSTEEELLALRESSNAELLLPCRLVMLGKRGLENTDNRENNTWEWLDEGDLGTSLWLNVDDLLVVVPHAEEAEALIQRVQEKGARWDMDVCALTSGECMELSSVRLAYEKARRQYTRWFYQPAGTSIELIEDFAWSCKPDFSYEDFSSSLYRHDRASGMAQFRRLFAHARENGGQVDPTLLVQRCEEIIHIGVLFREHNAPDMEATRDMLVHMHSLGEFVTADALLEFMEDFLSELWEPDQVSDDNSVVKAALLYVNTHYKGSVTLHQLAAQLHVNYCYLSRVFHQKTGMGLSDTVTSLRIQDAKQALRQSRRSIAAIGQDVGYMDAGYFSRVFKRVTGCTPSEYREGMQED